MASDQSSISLKLLLDTKGEKLIFAEAGKDFVDFLFHISYLPHGTVMKFLSKGCLHNIYKSVENHGDLILQPGQYKQDILQPRIVTIGGIDHTDPWSLPMIKTETTPFFKVCKCNNSQTKIGRRCRALCQKCDLFNPSGYFVDQQAKETVPGKIIGYAKGTETFMVMDDLLVKPISAASTITLLKSYDIENISNVETREVILGGDEALKLLKASMYSKTVLTDVFLRN